jgi:Mn2+/Fe2+ NRAMP family transporter
MKSYLIKILLLSLVLAIGGAILFTMVLPQYYLPVFPWVLLFFTVSSAVIHAYQMHMAKSDLGKFTRGNMILTFVKLLLYSAFAIIYFAIDTENAKIFVAVFLFIYLVFAVFEVIALAGLTKTKK